MIIQIIYTIYTFQKKRVHMICLDINSLILKFQEISLGPFDCGLPLVQPLMKI